LTVLLSFNVVPSFAITTTPQCQVANLSLAIGDRISPKTQEAGDTYVLTNRSKPVCQLRGYPGVSFYDSKGWLLPFKYARGRGAGTFYVMQAAPKTVVLHPGGHAFFFIAKSACVLGEAMIASTIRVYSPNSTRQLVGRAFLPVGVSTLAYCKGGPKAPGRLGEISPVAASERATVTTIMH
jgi:hypothetical protein